MEQCDACDGAGERCLGCHEIPDNCDCSVETYEDCQECGGSGEQEVDEDDNEEGDDDE